MQNRKQFITDISVFIIGLLGYAAACFLLFHRQTLGDTFHYNSDMPAYILHIQGLESGYDFPYPIYFLVGKLIYLITGNPHLGMSIATTLFCVFTAVIIKYALNHCCFEGRKPGLAASVLTTFLTFGLLFCSMLYFDWTSRFDITYRYLGVFSGTPWQNGTYLAARPFMLLSFIWFLRVMSVYEEGFRREHLKDYVLYSLFLLLATMTKPSFTILHLMVAGCIMLFRFFKSVFKNFVPSFQLALFYIPTLLALLYQYRGVFIGDGSSEERGIGLGFFVVWRLYVRVRSLPLAIILAMAFPILVLILHLPKLFRNSMLCSAWGTYGAGLLTTAFLYEKGFRSFHFNFAWGYICGIFLCFFVSVIEMLKDTIYVFGSDTERSERGLFSKTPRQINYCFLLLEWSVFLLHLVFGILYFFSLLRGENFF